jgi:para-nitrobenzyl esterase
VLGVAAVTAAGCSARASSHAHAVHATARRFPLVVVTDRGAVRGALSADRRVLGFLGMPYAAPPVRGLRWRPPQPVAAWTGIRAADHYREVCAQPSSGDGPSSTSEDCLYINVQRPALGSVHRRLPVYVYIHGGGLITGAGSYYDMAKIVRDAGVIGVTFNYRLGVFGFLAHPGLSAEQSGDYGFLDQQAALRWVHRNIPAFGGDPLRVTVGGESAGGWSVCAHLVSPHSRGLFSQAMIQSGSCQTQTPDQAVAAGSALAADAGCAVGNAAAQAACLRALPAADLVQAERSPDFTALLVRGTRALPHDPLTAIREGRFARVRVVIGATLDEARLFTSSDIGQTETGYENWVRSTFGSNAHAVLGEYPWPTNADQFTPAYLTGAIFTDAGLIGPMAPTVETGVGGCGTLALIKDIARYTTVYAYEWAQRDRPGIRQIPGYANGAAHAGELGYLWPNFTEDGVRVASLFNRDERLLSDEIINYWGAFVKEGAPHVVGQPPWPPYSGSSPVQLSLRARGKTRLLNAAAISAEHHCSLWNSLTGG